jgi:hypothetical protein
MRKRRHGVKMIAVLGMNGMTKTWDNLTQTEKIEYLHREVIHIRDRVSNLGSAVSKEMQKLKRATE